MLGLTTGTYEALAPTREWCVRYGSTAAPDVCWLGLRGLRTLSVRLERHQASALEVAAWLERQPEVERVLYPALPSDPDHELWQPPVQWRTRALLDRVAGLQRGRLMRASSSRSSSSAWAPAGAASRASSLPAIPQARRGLEPQPDDGRLVRLHIGLEDPADLIADLEQGLARPVTSAARTFMSGPRVRPLRPVGARDHGRTIPPPPLFEPTCPGPGPRSWRQGPAQDRPPGRASRHGPVRLRGLSSTRRSWSSSSESSGSPCAHRSPTARSSICAFSEDLLRGGLRPGCSRAAATSCPTTPSRTSSWAGWRGSSASATSSRTTHRPTSRPHLDAEELSFYFERLLREERETEVPATLLLAQPDLALGRSRPARCAGCSSGSWTSACWSRSTSATGGSCASSIVAGRWPIAGRPPTGTMRRHPAGQHHGSRFAHAGRRATQTLTLGTAAGDVAWLLGRQTAGVAAYAGVAGSGLPLLVGDEPLAVAHDWVCP